MSRSHNWKRNYVSLSHKCGRHSKSPLPNMATAVNEVRSNDHAEALTYIVYVLYTILPDTPWSLAGTSATSPQLL